MQGCRVLCGGKESDQGHGRRAVCRRDDHAILTKSTMTGPAHHIDYSWQDYLELEASSNVKHEYLAGQIYAMAGGTPEHAALAAAASGLLFGAVRGGRCRVLDSDLRVRVRATGLATYPDVTVVCDPWERDPDDEHAITNPTLIVEVLSRSTEQYDRGDKFEHYKHLASLREYVLVSHAERAIEVWRRDTTAGWTSTVIPDGNVAELRSIGGRLVVHELYDVASEPKA